MPPVMIAYAPCFLHGGIFGFDPDRVQTIMIDPVTGTPPDVSPVTGETLDPDTALVKERLARAVQRVLCPGCCTKLNAAARQLGIDPRFDETDTSAGQVQA
jgi:hypothetical protein